MRLSDERDLVLNGNTWRGNASDAALSLTQELSNTQSNIYPISTEVIQSFHSFRYLVARLLTFESCSIHTSDPTQRSQV